MKKILISLLSIIVFSAIGLFFYQNSQFKSSISNIAKSINSDDGYQILTTYNYKFPNSTIVNLHLGFKGLDNKTQLPVEIEFDNKILNGVISLQTNFNEETCMCENFKLPINVNFNNPNDNLNFSNLYLSTNQSTINKQTNIGGVSLKNALIDVIIKNYKSEFPEANISTSLESFNINSNVHNFSANINELKSDSVISLFNYNEQKYPFLKEETTSLDDLEISNLSIGMNIKNMKSKTETEPYNDRIRKYYNLNIDEVKLPVSNHFKSLSSLNNFSLNIENDINIEKNNQFINFLIVQSKNITNSPFFTTYIILDKLFAFNEGEKIKYNISSESINDYSLHLSIESPQLEKNEDIVKINKEDNFQFYLIIYSGLIDDINKISQSNNLESLIASIENNNIGFKDKNGNLIINIKTEYGKIVIEDKPDEYKEFNSFDMKKIKTLLFKANKEYLKSLNK